MNDDALYTVVVNEQGQYSIWPAERPLPAGWRAEGEPTAKADCLAYIERTWTDMRPHSIRTARPPSPR